MTASAPVAVPTKRAKHLYEVDIVRILTFLCVIAVHTTSHTAAASDIGLYAILGLVHFTRDVFFALSAFVLVYSYLSKPVPMSKFWPRRFLLVGVPYVVWSAIYFTASNVNSPHGTILDALGRFLQHLVTGTAWYHLYFLLVTMQVYLLVPVIVWFVKKTRRHHVAMLSVAFVLQVAFYWYLAYGSTEPAWLESYSKVYFFTYTFFILLGAVLADHARQLMAWVAGHRRLIGWITLGTGLFTLAVFAFVHWVVGYSYYRSGTPLQPVMVVWSIAIGLAFLAIGSYWSERRTAGSRFSRLVDTASDRSFGIFLSHPLVLWLILLPGPNWLTQTIPDPWSTIVAYLTVIVGAVLITEVARRLPVSLALTGRPYRRRVVKPRTPPAEAGDVPSN
ncbi:MAG: acyltransferase [Microbacteriaceae bacterium]|nr:acyltransferase [Microbacteriaceae bacterium]